MKQQTKIT